MLHCLTEEGHVCTEILNNQPFCESALHKLEKRQAAGGLFARSIIAKCSSSSCWPEKALFSKDLQTMAKTMLPTSLFEHFFWGGGGLVAGRLTSGVAIG